MATSPPRILPPQIPGYEKFDLYPAGADNKGDLDKAKAALEACGQPDGFETNMAYRAERPKEKATAEAFQQALARVGIKLTLKGFPSGDYFSQYAGNPPYVVEEQPRPGAPTAGARTGTTASASCRRSSTAGSSGRPVARPTPASGSPRSTRCSTQALAETDTGQARGDLGRRSTSGSWRRRSSYPGVYAKACCCAARTLTNVFVNDAFGMYDYLSHGRRSNRTRSPSRST